MRQSAQETEIMLIQLTRDAHTDIPSEFLAAARRVGGHIHREGGPVAQCVWSYGHYDLEVEKRETVQFRTWDGTENRWDDSDQIEIIWFEGTAYRWYWKSTSRSGYGRAIVLRDSLGRGWGYRNADGAILPMLPLDEKDSPEIFILKSGMNGETWVLWATPAGAPIDRSLKKCEICGASSGSGFLPYPDGGGRCKRCRPTAELYGEQSSFVNRFADGTFCIGTYSRLNVRPPRPRIWEKALRECHELLSEEQINRASKVGDELDRRRD